MGLTPCPNCGKAISEKATLCPHCNLAIFRPTLTVCEDCQQEYDASMAACPNCGCPNPSVRQKSKKHKYVIVAVIVIALLAILASGITVSQKVKELQYYENMKAASYAMLDGAAEAEDAGNLIVSVWHNAIFEKQDDKTDRYTMKDGKFFDDFNDALSCLLADADFSNSIYEIEANQVKVAKLMKMLKDPPKKYEEAYSVLKTYYDNYLKFTTAVINPTGSLNTFSEYFSTYDKNTSDSFSQMKLYLE